MISVEFVIGLVLVGVHCQPLVYLPLAITEHITDTIYQQFITLDCPQGLLDSAVLQVTSSEQSLLEQEHVILNLNSLSITRSKMGRLHVVLDPVCVLVGWLEEMLYEAMVSAACLREKYLLKGACFSERQLRK